jgi:hypothetical protein
VWFIKLKFSRRVGDLRYLPVIHNPDAVSEMKDARVVGHDNKGAIPVEGLLAKELHNFAARGVV